MLQEEVIQFTGIKCDNEKCDYSDMTVTFEQYPQYVNKPCPKCGENLLTQENYDACVIYANMMTALSNNPELMKMATELEKEMNLNPAEVQELAEATLSHIEDTLKSERNTD